MRSMHKTRHFFRISSLVGILLVMFLFSCNSSDNNLVKIIILHTNDTHSQLDPFPGNHPRFPLMSGYARRAWLIDSIRHAEENVLVFDCGDFSQGTPYYNLFKGEPEVLLMNKLKYDAATLGNHEFDYGLENLAKILKLAEFPILSANYLTENTPIQNLVAPYRIFAIKKIRIGVFGLGVQLNGLAPDKLIHGVKVMDPIEVGNETAFELKTKHKCDLVICLSHLGLENKQQADDIKLAQSSSDIDIILGGHSHTPLENGMWVKNKQLKNILIAQAGYGGVSVGKIVIYISRAAL
jgi:5'-nucleotidase